MLSPIIIASNILGLSVLAGAGGADDIGPLVPDLKKTKLAAAGLAVRAAGMIHIGASAWAGSCRGDQSRPTNSGQAMLIAVYWHQFPVSTCSGHRCFLQNISGPTGALVESSFCGCRVAACCLTWSPRLAGRHHEFLPYFLWVSFAPCYNAKNSCSSTLHWADGLQTSPCPPADPAIFRPASSNTAGAVSDMLGGTCASRKRALQAIVRIRTAAPPPNCYKAVLQDFRRKFRWHGPQARRRLGPAFGGNLFIACASVQQFADRIFQIAGRRRPAAPRPRQVRLGNGCPFAPATGPPGPRFLGSRSFPDFFQRGPGHCPAH